MRMRPFASEGGGGAWRVSGFRRGIIAAQEGVSDKEAAVESEGEYALCLSSRLGYSWRQTKHDAAKSQRQGEARPYSCGLSSMLI